MANAIAVALGYASDPQPGADSPPLTISRLRRKLGEPTAIDTITNVGYRITKPAAPPPD